MQSQAEREVNRLQKKFTQILTQTFLSSVLSAKQNVIDATKREEKIA